MKRWCNGQIHLYFWLIFEVFVEGWAITASERAGNDIFAIQHQKLKECLQVNSSGFTMNKCNQLEELQQWKWVSEHRLFNIGSKKCLGLDPYNKEQPLKMFECDAEITTMWWRCRGGTLYGSSSYKLTVIQSPTASIDATDAWKQSGGDNDVCEQPYHRIYTFDGTAYGKPCVFPFKYRRKWYYECTTENSDDEEWCATTANYDKDRKWGKCLKPDTECKTFWKKDSAQQTCYQFNFESFLSWNEARLACQSQGGDLLSIADPKAQKYVSEQPNIPRKLWIGLNQMNVAGGWQWSDGTPLMFVNWDDGIFDLYHLEESSCATMNLDSDGRWQVSPCEAALPYACKKPLNQTGKESIDPWKYSNTECEAGWLAHNGFCYYMNTQDLKWDDADSSCKSNESQLISVHSLADVELVASKLHEAYSYEIWTGLRSDQFPALFKWSDGSPVTFTYWDQAQPNIPYNTTKHCVSYVGKLGRWKFAECDSKLSFVCKKQGKTLNETDLSDVGCPQDKSWRRHGNYCYKLDLTEVGFESKCHLTIQNRFEQEFINSLIAKHTTENGKYFWTSFQDRNGTGEYTWFTTSKEKEPVTYTNWNAYQPASPGGCVVMATGKTLGRWEIRNCKSFKAMSICKKSISNTTETEETPPKGSCPPGWQTNADLQYCYKVFHHERVVRKRTWEEAERFCESLGAHLPSFIHHDEMLYLHSLLRKTITDERWFWVGLNKRNPDSKGSWEWSDSRPVSLVTIPFDFKEDDYAVRDCGAFQTQKPLWHRFMMFDIRRKYDYHLMPFHCDIKLEWVCQIPKGTKLRRPPWYIPDGESIHGPTVVIDGNEYWFVNNTKLTYQEADLYCSRNESKLASITSRPAIKMIKTHLLKHFPSLPKWWVKAINYNTLSSPFFGPYYIYDRFHSYHNRYRDCWFITPFVRLIEYHDFVDCARPLPFICQKLNISSLEPWSPETNVSGSPCTGDWIPFGDNCYNFVKPKALTWEAGNRFCQSLGGNLPTIANSVEQDFIVSHLSSLPPRIWLGLQTSTTAGTNKWVTERPVDYTNWRPSFEMEFGILDFDIFQLEKQCAVLLNDPGTPFIGKWDMVTCGDEKFVAVCQKHRDIINEEDTHPLNDTLNFLNHTYTIIRKNLTWEEAVTECQEHNNKLVSITEPYHQAFLTVTTNTLGYPVWIGLYSQDDGLHFRWSDGRHTTYSHWSKGDSVPVDNCVYMDIDGYWRTLSCDSILEGAICHDQQKETAPEKPDVETVKCPHKIEGPLWIPFRNNCYAFLLNAEKPRFFQGSTVHSMCKKLDPQSNILTIRSEEENNFVTDQLKIHSYLFKWVWLSVQYNGNHTIWYDGSYIKYSNWHLGRPNFRDAQMFPAVGLGMDGFWHHFNHPLLRTQLMLQSIFVCKIDKDPDPSHFEAPRAKAEYGNHTYQLIQRKLNWYEALQQCQMSGYQLVSVYNESQHLFLKSLVKSDGFPLWIGLFSQDEGSTFEWSDGCNSEYKPWEYQNLNADGSCVFMDTKGFWNRADCNSDVEGAICYASQSKKTSPSQPEKRSDFCPQKNGKPSWVTFRGHCYAFDMGLYNWSVFTMEETKTICSKLDPSADILSIKDREENDFVTSQIREEQGITGRVWLGISPGQKDKSLLWPDGSNLTYANWINNNLSVPTHDKCAVISSKNGTWILTSCSKSHSRVVCKAPMRSSHKVAALVITVVFIFLLIGGVVWFLYKRNKWRWANPFGTVHYERSYNDPTDSDSTIMISELKEFHD
ncbi:lymphocyte antigen 75 isoform X2 [Stegostoma tigrinum]|uniref:lymphocyte antigen 75 isoform X2 n=1 Tax=Stegostoma tigrinum TaxID=3053191 RepID=UPI00202B7513|nr:lymphocyte antigen 75 isoform X2 [Stegostoma tigrinum]